MHNLSRVVSVAYTLIFWLVTNFKRETLKTLWRILRLLVIRFILCGFAFMRICMPSGALGVNPSQNYS